jgi:hypothetical protein
VRKNEINAEAWQQRENSNLRDSTATRYAALKALVDIANHVHAEGRQTDFVALARSLAHAQELADTPSNARLGEVSLVQLQDGPALAISPLVNIPIGEFYYEVLDMRGNLLDIAKGCQKARGRLYGPVAVIRREHRYLCLSPDFTIDPGPDLFADTLFRALAGRDARRIRLCPKPKCLRLFIAVPSDKITCSRECASAQRVHKFLANHPGYYAREKRQQRAQRKRDAKRSSSTQSKTGRP